MKKTNDIIKNLKNLYFGVNCVATKEPITLGDRVRFINNDLYTWQEFTVEFSIRSSKFYLKPANYGGKPISLIQEYLGCDDEIYPNELIKISKKIKEEEQDNVENN